MSEVTTDNQLAARLPGLWTRQRRRAAQRQQTWDEFRAPNPCPWVDTLTGSTINRQQRRHYERVKRQVLNDIDWDIIVAEKFSQHETVAKLHAHRQRVDQRIQPRWTDAQGRPVVAEVPQNQMRNDGSRMPRRARRFLAACRLNITGAWGQ